MALTREERDMYARELMAGDPELDYALALTQVDEMEANGAFTPITNEQDEVAPWDTTEDEVAPWGDTEEVAPWDEEVAPWDEPVADPAPSTAPIRTDVVGPKYQAAPTWQDTDEDSLEAPVSVPEALAKPIEPTPSFADGGLERGLEAVTKPQSPLIPMTPEEKSQREFEQRHRDKFAPPREAVKEVISNTFDYLSDLLPERVEAAPGTYFSEREQKNEEKLAEEPSQWAVASQAGAPAASGVTLDDVITEEREQGVTQHWEDLVENNARQLYIDGKADTPDAARKMAMDEHMGNVVEQSVNFATLFIPGVAPARWAYQFGKLAFAGKVSALVAAGMTESVAAGVAGNLAAGRAWDEGIKDDAIWGAAGGAAAGVIGGGVDVYRASRTAKVEKAATELVDEKATRTMARDEFKSAAELKEVVDDIAKDVDLAKPQQVARAAKALPEGQVKDKMKDLSEGLEAIGYHRNANAWARALPEGDARSMLQRYHGVDEAGQQAGRKHFQTKEGLSDLYVVTRDTLRDLPDTMDNAMTRELLTENLEKLKKMGGARQFFKQEDAVRQTKELVNDKLYNAQTVADEAGGKYTALARLMDEGTSAKLAVDTSYLDNTRMDRVARGVESKVGAGIPGKIRSAKFNEAQGGVRNSALEEVTKRIDELSTELADDALKGAKRKGKRHELAEMRKVSEDLKTGKEVKLSDYAKSFDYLPPALQRELDGVQALQQYSKETKAMAKPEIVDASTAAVGHGILGLATGGAYWGKQLATSIAIPALRTASQATRKNAILKANSLVEKHAGDMTKIMEDIGKMKSDDAQNTMAVLLFRLEAALSTPTEMEGVGDVVFDAASDLIWQE